MIGEIVEHAIWFSGDSDEQKRKAEVVIRVKFESEVWTYGPVEFETLDPENERAPEPPKKWFQENPKLLVGFATITGTPQIDKGMSDDLDNESLAGMRAATRRSAGNHLTDAECDEYINSLGPETAYRVIN